MLGKEDYKKYLKSVSGRDWLFLASGVVIGVFIYYILIGIIAVVSVILIKHFLIDKKKDQIDQKNN